MGLCSRFGSLNGNNSMIGHLNNFSRRKEELAVVGREVSHSD